MAVKRKKLQESAQKYLGRGQYDKAIEALEQLVKKDPKDVRALMKLGDVYRRTGDREMAGKTYERVAERYAAQGFFLKAIAVFKQVVQLDAARIDIQARIAEMYGNLDLISDALSIYEQVSSFYMRSGELDKAVTMMSRMVELDPENISSRIQYAETLSRLERNEPAVEQLEICAGQLKEQGRTQDYIKVAERLLYLRKEDVNLTHDLAEMYLQHEDPKNALAKLQTAFNIDGENIITLELLAKTFAALEQVDKAVSVHREIARLHREEGREQRYIEALNKLLELQPDDEEASQELKQALEGTPQASKAAAPPETREDSVADILTVEGSDLVMLEPSGSHPLLNMPLSETNGQSSQSQTKAKANGFLGLKPMSFEEFEAIPIVKVKKARGRKKKASQLETNLEQVDAYLISANWEQAESLINELRAELPSHPLIQDKAKELQLLRSEQMPAPAPQIDETDADIHVLDFDSDPTELMADILEEVSDSIDLDSIRPEAKAAEPPSDKTESSDEQDPSIDLMNVDQVVHRFQEDTAEQIEDDDDRTHYDLGIAYKGMGLYKQARDELEIAAKSPSQSCRAWTMIGICFLDEGKSKEAIDAFQKAIDSEVTTEEEEIALYYEMANAYENAGDEKAALENFERVQAADAEFRDVAARIDSLRKG